VFGVACCYGVFVIVSVWVEWFELYEGIEVCGCYVGGDLYDWLVVMLCRSGVGIVWYVSVDFDLVDYLLDLL